MHGDGVTRLVVGDDFLFLGRDQAAAPFGPGNHALDCFLQFVGADRAAVAASSQDGGLVHQVLDIGPSETRGLLGDNIKVHVGRQRLTTHVHVKNGTAALDVGHIHRHTAVKAAGPQQRRVENVGPVGRSDDNDVRISIEAVHLDEDLVERLLALVVRAAQAGATMAAHGVDLVDKNDTRGILLGLLEEVAHTAGADADKHLHKFGTGDAEEGHAGFARHGLGHQRLACAGRADQQHALGDACAQGGKLLRLLEELDDFLQFLLGLVVAGDVDKSNCRPVARKHTGAALAKAKGLVARTLRLAHDEKEEGAQQRQGHERQEHVAPDIPELRIGDADFNLAQLLGRHAKVGQGVNQPGLILNAGLQRLAAGLGYYEFVVVDRDRVYVARAHQGSNIADRNCGYGRSGPPHQRRIEEGSQGDHQRAGRSHHCAVA